MSLPSILRQYQTRMTSPWELNRIQTLVLTCTRPSRTTCSRRHKCISLMHSRWSQTGLNLQRAFSERFWSFLSDRWCVLLHTFSWFNHVPMILDTLTDTLGFSHLFSHRQQNLSLEESWSLLSLFEKSHRGRITKDLDLENHGKYSRHSGPMVSG